MQQRRLGLGLLFSVIFVGCSQPVRRDLYEQWVQRNCCTASDILSLSTLSLSPAGGISIQFCEDYSVKDLLINLTRIDNHQGGVIFDLLGFVDTAACQVLVKIDPGEIPPWGRGDFYFTDPLPAGLFELFIGTESACGRLIFSKVSDDEVKVTESACIVFCK